MDLLIVEYSCFICYMKLSDINVQVVFVSFEWNVVWVGERRETGVTQSRTVMHGNGRIVSTISQVVSVVFTDGSGLIQSAVKACMPDFHRWRESGQCVAGSGVVRLVRRVTCKPKPEPRCPAGTHLRRSTVQGLCFMTPYLSQVDRTL